MNRNYPALVGGLVRFSVTEGSVSAKKTGNWTRAAFLTTAVFAVAAVALYCGTAVVAAQDSRPNPAAAAHTTLAPKALSLPLFFEPNQGQTDPQVKFLARGAGYGLFLTSDEAVLELLYPAVSTQHSAPGSHRPALDSPATSSVIRMRLDGASASARVSGASPLPGKSNYFLGNDLSQWRQNIPQFARVQYDAVYPGIDLVYYGHQGQLEYDFRLAPGSDPKQIALSFQGASACIDGGDLILSTGEGDVRFQAPRIYQPAVAASNKTTSRAEKAVAGSFRQLAGNKIGFAIGDYDRSRELIIDPTLSYSTYLGGSSGTELLTQVAVEGGYVYVAGSTTSTNFPQSTQYYPTTPPYQSTLAGTQNIFIAVFNPSLQPPAYLPAQQLLYATYLGGSGTDSLAGLAVDANFSIYVAGTTNSPNFPTTSNAFRQAPQTGTHGFVSKLAFPTAPASQVYGLAYSTYLAGNGVDTVTGLAVDTNQNAYVTGDTTSSNSYTDNFPANPNGFQLASNSPGNPQFFATMISTSSGLIRYSTYLGGGIPAVAIAQGGGIAVDSTGNMYFTGTTNMLPPSSSSSAAGFPLFNAQQACLDQPGVIGACASTSPTDTDAIAVKINPTQAGANPVYSTYLGGSGNDAGTAIAVDSSGNAYVTGLTYSTDWFCSCSPGPFQIANGGGGDAYIATIGPVSGSIYPLIYFTYLGGSGLDFGSSIQVDAVQNVHLTGTTDSSNFPVTPQTLQTTLGGGDDAFVAQISVTSGGTSATPLGDYVTYLGGSQLDQGTGIAIDTVGNTYVAGVTRSPNFPASTTSTPFQSSLNGTQNAFMSILSAKSQLVILPASGSPAPSPVPAGTQVAFTYNILNMGPDTATNVVFYANGLPLSSELSATPQAKVTAGVGTCQAEQGVQAPEIICNIQTLAAGSTASVEIDITPSITGPLDDKTFSISSAATANNGGSQLGPAQTVQVVDFSAAAQNSTPSVTAGDIATIQVTFCPTLPSFGYTATITPTQSASPSIVTATTPTFSPTTVALSGSACGSTTLSIATVARPVNNGSLHRRRSTFYAAWLPIGGLSLIGLGIGAGYKRRRWLIGALLGLIAGVMLLQAACGSASTTVATAGGTAAGIYTITVTGAAATGASHATQVQLQVN